MKFSIIDTQKNINIQNKKLDLKEVLNYLNTASAHKDSCITIFEDTEEYNVKLNWIEKNKWKVDYPIRMHEIHKQRYVSLRQGLQAVEIIYKTKDIYNLKGFYDVPVRHFTLDEMIQFKKEDEMMLRGEDPDKGNTQPQTLTKKELIPKKQKESKPSMIIGEQLGTEKNQPSSTPSQPKPTTPKQKKPSKSDDDGFFSI